MVNLWLKPKLQRETIGFFRSIESLEGHQCLLSLLKFYTAPTRLGFKVGTLVNLTDSHRNLKKLWQENKYLVEEVLDLDSIDLSLSEDSVRIYFYKPHRLARRLKDKRVGHFLSQCGYENCQTTCQYIEKLQENFLREKTCPHEVGIFLGYPLEDVKAFHKKDTNCKYTGYWKCYSNVFLSQCKFFVYDLSKWSVIRKLSNIPYRASS